MFPPMRADMPTANVVQGPCLHGQGEEGQGRVILSQSMAGQAWARQGRVGWIGLGWAGQGQAEQGKAPAGQMTDQIGAIQACRLQLSCLENVAQQWQFLLDHMEWDRADQSGEVQKES